MKHVIFSAVFVAFLFAGIQAQSRLDLKSEPVKNDLLVEILNWGEMQELKTPSPNISPYFLRLYSIKEIGGCVSAAETEVVCSIRYYLAVTDGSLGVAGAVYSLGEVGEITKIHWLESPNRDIARLRLEITNYPKWAFVENPKLVKKTRSVEIEVNTDMLKIKVIK